MDSFLSIEVTSGSKAGVTSVIEVRVNIMPPLSTDPVGKLGCYSTFHEFEGFLNSSGKFDLTRFTRSLLLHKSPPQGYRLPRCIGQSTNTLITSVVRRYMEYSLSYCNIATTANITLREKDTRPVIHFESLCSFTCPKFGGMMQGL